MQEKATAQSGAESGFVFRDRAPCARLAPFVRRCWYARGWIAYRRDHILPNGSAVLLFSLGLPHATGPAAHPERPQMLHDAWVCGLQARALVNEPLGETHVVGASFATAGAAFFGPPMSELVDRVAPLEALWGRDARGLRERIYEAPTNAAYSLGSCRPRVGWRAWSWPCAGCCCRAPTGSRPSRATSSSRPSSSSRSSTGWSGWRRARSPASPGCAASSTRSIRDVPWAELAAGHGWSDQAHLVRDFKAFGGAMPAEDVRRRRDAFGPDLKPGQDSIFLPSR